MPDNDPYREMMDKTLAAYSETTGHAMPDPQTFQEIEQNVIDYLKEEGK